MPKRDDWNWTRSTDNRSKGSFGEPIARSIGSTWTRREFTALKRLARFGSVAKAIRSLIDPQKLEQVIVETESAAAQSHDRTA